MNECLLCGAPGGYPYCNESCREADAGPDHEPQSFSASSFGPLTDLNDPWETGINEKRET